MESDVESPNQKPTSLRPLASSPAMLSGDTPSRGIASYSSPISSNCVDLNNDLLERVGASMDEFKMRREKEEASGRGDCAMEADGFQIVNGRMKRDERAGNSGSGDLGVRMAQRERSKLGVRPKVPFHIASLPRPQQEFNIRVNNSNIPIDHVWLEKSEDGSRRVHPLEKLSVSNFVDRDVREVDSVKPPPVENTPFTFVDSLKELKDLVSKLQGVNEFAVDLEHNHYRSFQGLTCLMQISTRTEDFLIDTLKLHLQVGPHLREVFKDPAKRKVMHGADCDILWLQRDFRIYVCNLFDTGQASRIMQLERNSLEYLLQFFCGVTANKEYQNSDWRLRPIPDEMLKYAREDTHYLLHIYDLMRNSLLSSSSSKNDLLLEVYKRSYEVCMQLYERELLTDISYLYIYGLKEANFNAKQLAIASGLYEWRDRIAREEDESTGYILPNKALLEIARQMPTTCGRLMRLIRSKYPYVEQHLDFVTYIIKSSIENSSSFESISDQLKKERLEIELKKNIDFGCNLGLLPAFENPKLPTTHERGVVYAASKASTTGSAGTVTTMDVSVADDVNSITASALSELHALSDRCRQVKKPQAMQLSEIGCSFELPKKATELEKEKMGHGNFSGLTKKVSLASLQISEKSTGSVGELFERSSSWRMYSSRNDVAAQQEGNINWVQQIKSSAFLPFHSFSGRANASESSPEATCKTPQPETVKLCSSQPADMVQVNVVIPLENVSGKSEPHAECLMTSGSLRHGNHLLDNGRSNYSPVDLEMAERPMSLADLSSRFEGSFQLSERKGNKQHQSPHRLSESNFHLDHITTRETLILEKQ